MANGYDQHSADRMSEARASSEVPLAMRDRRFTRTGIGYRTQREAAYAGGTAGRVRGDEDRSRAWMWVEAATDRPPRPREAVPAGLAENDDWGGFPCEDEARDALGVLSQFLDGPTLDKVRDGIEKTFGEPDPGMPYGGMGDPTWDDRDEMGEAAVKEAPLDAKRRNALPGSAFALPGRKYPIDTPARARAALSRVEQFGSDSEKSRVRAAVKKRYPDMEVD